VFHHWNDQELLAVKTNPEIKGPRRRRGRVRFKYIVWGSSLVMEQHAIVQSLTLRKLSANDITVELEAVYRHEILAFGSEEGDVHEQSPPTLSTCL
jgi:hypothetical protein